jgi:hypothetical protein
VAVYSLSKDEWFEKIKKMKEDSERKIAEDRHAEEQLKEKYEEERKKIIEMLDSELKKVAEIFKSPDLQEYEQPEADISGWGGHLSVPIAHDNTHMELGVTFSPTLTDTGYGLNVEQEGYDTVQEKPYRTRTFIPPPIIVESIRGELEKFLESREYIVERMEEKRRRYLRK